MNMNLSLRIGIDDTTEHKDYMEPQRPLVVIAGSFDPFHKGHLQLVQRAQTIFPCGRIVVVVYNKFPRKPQTPLYLRLEEVTEELEEYANVEVVSWSGLPIPAYIAYTKGADCFFTASNKKDLSRKRFLSQVGKFIFPGMKIIISRMKGGSSSIITRSIRKSVREREWGKVQNLVPESLFPLLKTYQHRSR